ncbi:hypothetical protein GCM10010124_00110 [Pilimelia terevasa]|uniref:Uncharacterized protein n=1 Tax=Pilimelia terevasa TaxID=53372 RepID=A0A8J3BDE3_9ACTN|nr:hypothetical protein [Pilimelia terevasa]GGK11453.1 hypothetical protein GCM10010124_00110 [Pilimelia terevasa]
MCRSHAQGGRRCPGNRNRTTTTAVSAAGAAPTAAPNVTPTAAAGTAPAAAEDPGAYYAQRADAWRAAATDPTAHPVDRDRARAEVRQWDTLAGQARAQATPAVSGEAVDATPGEVRSGPVAFGPDATVVGRVVTPQGTFRGDQMPADVAARVQGAMDMLDRMGVTNATRPAGNPGGGAGHRPTVTIGTNHGQVAAHAEGTFTFGGPGGFTFTGTTTPADIPTGRGERVETDKVVIEENHGQYTAGRVEGTFHFGSNR